MGLPTVRHLAIALISLRVREFSLSVNVPDFHSKGYGSLMRVYPNVLILLLLLQCSRNTTSTLYWCINWVAVAVIDFAVVSTL